MFVLDADYGMGDCRIAFKGNNSCAIMLSALSSFVASESVKFWVNVDSIDDLYERYKSIAFLSGGGFFSDDGIFDYPLARSITMRDPSGNLFVIQQKY